MYRLPRVLRPCRHGTASVEFALVLPLLLALLFGIMEFGFLFKDQLSLQQCAREGARVAAVGRGVAEVNARITGCAHGLVLNRLTFTKTWRTYANGVWSEWTTMADRTDGSGDNDAPQGAQIRIACTYEHYLLTGPLFARLIGRPGATSMTLQAEMVIRRE